MTTYRVGFLSIVSISLERDSRVDEVVVFPQRELGLVSGEAPLALVSNEVIPLETITHGFPKWLQENRYTVWMLSTNIPLSGVMYKKNSPLYSFYWDGSETPSWEPRYEFLMGTRRKHGIIHRRWGTQPINTYLRGHFCLKPIYGVPDGWARAQDEGDHVQIQQYFKSGWWGSADKYSKSDRIVIREQIAQNNVGIPLLLDAGILKPESNIYFMDQSKHIDEIAFGHDPFKLFKASEWRKYYEWLPEYLREFRPNDFGMPIEEFIDRYVRDGLERGN